MYATLRDFLNALEQAGELHRITALVDPCLEVTEIVDRVSKSPAAHVSEHAKAFDPKHVHLGGKALLFENVAGAKFPLAINTLGSYRRMEMAMNATDGGFEALASRIGELVKPQSPTGLMQKMKKGLELAKIASFAPKQVRGGVCQEVVKEGDDVNLFDLPILKCWPLDGNPQKVGYPAPVPGSATHPGRGGVSETSGGGGRFITFGGMYSIHPDDAGLPEGQPRPSRNVGMYRAQLIDRNHTAMHWHMHHDGASHWRAWKRLGRPMPLAIVLGGESVLPYAATAPLPPGISELLLAGFLAGRGIELVRCKTIDMHVPANAEIVLEGYVSTEAGFPGYDPRTDGPVGDGAVFEGPFGDHTGFYSLPDRYPLFEVTAMTHRKKAVYPTTIVGLPPQEDYYMGKATERLFLPLLKTMIHDVLDYDLPMFGAFHNCAFIKIRKEYPLQARKVMHAIWGAGQMAWTKMLVIVDEDVNVHDYEEVMFHLCANCDPGRDFEVVNGPLDILDHAAPRLGAGSKVGFDATRKIKGEEVNGQPVRDWPPILEMSQEIKDQVTNRWSELGF